VRRQREGGSSDPSSSASSSASGTPGHTPVPSSPPLSGPFRPSATPSGAVREAAEGSREEAAARAALGAGAIRRGIPPSSAGPSAFPPTQAHHSRDLPPSLATLLEDSADEEGEADASRGGAPGAKPLPGGGLCGTAQNGDGGLCGTVRKGREDFQKKKIIFSKKISSSKNNFSSSTKSFRRGSAGTASSALRGSLSGATSDASEGASVAPQTPMGASSWVEPVLVGQQAQLRAVRRQLAALQRQLSITKASAEGVPPGKGSVGPEPGSRLPAPGAAGLSGHASVDPALLQTLVAGAARAEHHKHLLQPFAGEDLLKLQPWIDSVRVARQSAWADPAGHLCDDENVQLVRQRVEG
jgi:hypothetical protein